MDLTDRIRPLTGTDPDLPLDDLEPLRAVVGDAVVVGLGEATRFAHEVFALRERVLWFLVERMGFGVLALEVDPATGDRLNAWVHGGGEDVESVVDGAWGVWRTEEFLAFLHRLRGSGADVLVAGMDTSGHDPGVYDPASCAERIAGVRADTGRRIVYWGGTGHTAVHDPGPGHPEHPFPRTEGTFLREWLGRGYVSVGVTFGRGRTTLGDVAPAAPELAESLLAGTSRPVLLDLTGPLPDAQRVPARARVIGPEYDAARDAEFSIAGTPLATLFDAVGYVPEVTPVTPSNRSDAARAADRGSR